MQAAQLVASLTFGARLSAALTSAVARPEIYDGPYEFTPGAEAQTIAIDHKMAEQDITINPIPSNYGLITWNGAVLTVS